MVILSSHHNGKTEQIKDKFKYKYFYRIMFLCRYRWGWGSPYEHAGMKLIPRISDVKTYEERLIFIR